MNKTISPEHELEIQRGIRQAEDALVIAVEDALNTCEYPTSGRDKLEESQFRNLVRVADSTESPEVVKNFIRYQVGRERKWGRGEKSLAERIIQDIDSRLNTSAQEIVKAAQETDEKKRVWMELIRRYLGYGARHLRYLNSNSEG
ncbi:hypothetical protein PN498_12375 [Oscillatoria sp. CS-180]|uniref:hypothetical protein n=1 Tax=Oscillatoria sp. CS-180 TaxID=3021720 RepID=UPI00232DF8A3|nr:hypothetical protein [Oscillatoria sp. CS-180]MDB9526787.1 hypothetical protein [Oscillatoria sp. CS-180]